MHVKYSPSPGPKNSLKLELKQDVYRLRRLYFPKVVFSHEKRNRKAPGTPWRTFPWTVGSAAFYIVQQYFLYHYMLPQITVSYLTVAGILSTEQMLLLGCGSFEPLFPASDYAWVVVYESTFKRITIRSKTKSNA